MKKIQITQELFVKMLKYFYSDELGVDDCELNELYYDIKNGIDRTYGRMRLQYIKSERKCFYSNLMITGNLNEHLHEIDVQAQEILNQFIKAAEQTAPDKDAQQMEWVRHMNSAKASAKEVINDELIYV